MFTLNLGAVHLGSKLENPLYFCLSSGMGQARAAGPAGATAELGMPKAPPHRVTLEYRRHTGSTTKHHARAEMEHLWLFRPVHGEGQQTDGTGNRLFPKRDASLSTLLNGNSTG